MRKRRQEAIRNPSHQAPTQRRSLESSWIWSGEQREGRGAEDTHTSAEIELGIVRLLGYRIMTPGGCAFLAKDWRDVFVCVQIRAG